MAFHEDLTKGADIDAKMLEVDSRLRCLGLSAKRSTIAYWQLPEANR